jgi:hypothetical protein
MSAPFLISYKGINKLCLTQKMKIFLLILMSQFINQKIKQKKCIFVLFAVNSLSPHGNNGSATSA